MVHSALSKPKISLYGMVGHWTPDVIRKSLPFADRSLSVASPQALWLQGNLIRFFATKIFHFSVKTDGILTLSGSEANEIAVLMAKRSTKKNIVIASNLLHSSIANACKKLDMKLIILEANPQTWQVSPEKVLHVLRKHSKDVAMVCSTYGTTTLGSTEDFILDRKILSWCKKKKIWVHIDGAYGGTYLNLARSTPSAWQKLFLRAQSITVDPHKIVGMMGCGMLLLPTRLNKKLIGDEVSYFKGNLSALGTSREAWSAATAWFTLEHIGFLGLKKWAKACVTKARKTGEKLKKMGYFLLYPVQSGILSIALHSKKEQDGLIAFLREKKDLLVSPLTITGRNYYIFGIRLVVNPQPEMQSSQTHALFLSAMREWKKLKGY